MAKVVTPIKKEKKAEKREWNPEKAYKWDPKDTFELTGMQFASIYHLLVAEMNTPGGAPLGAKVEAHSVVMDVFKRGVEQGVIVETENMAEEFVDEDKDKVKELFPS